MTDAAILIPYDPDADTLMVVVSTYYHPTPQLRGCYKAIGGVIKPGETPEQALDREFAEEFPALADALWHRDRKKIGTVVVHSKNGQVTGHWHVFTVHVPLTEYLFRMMRRCATESTPHVVYRPRLVRELRELSTHALEEALDVYAGRVRDDFAYPLGNCFPGISACVSLFDYTELTPDLTSRKLRFIKS